MTTNCALYAIGNELLEGSIIDTNSAFISATLSRLGITVDEVSMLPDQRERLTAHLRSASDRFDLIVTTGGLGPTFDDLTSECISEATDRDCLFNSVAFAHIEAALGSKGVTIKDSHRRQAHLPEGATLFHNRMGTAYGFGVHFGRAFIVALPGVPYEMKPMFLEQVLPHLKKHFSLQERFMMDVRFAEIPESDVDDVLTHLGIPEGIEAIINASKGEIIVRLRSFQHTLVEKFADRLREALPRAFVGFSDETLAAVTLRLLRDRNETLSTAESCTGGLIGQELTSIPGSSDVYRGGLIVYSEEAKHKLLNVPLEILTTYGAVSSECAEAMVRNVMGLFSSTAGLSVTGFAGPSGGTPEHPVGTVFIGIGYGDSIKIRQLNLPGDRETIRLRAMKLGLKALINLIRSSS